MKVADLIVALLKQYVQYGNLEVGFRDVEFSCFFSIEEVGFRKAERGASEIFSDDVTLGDAFITIL